MEEHPRADLFPGLYGCDSRVPCAFGRSSSDDARRVGDRVVDRADEAIRPYYYVNRDCRDAGDDDDDDDDSRTSPSAALYERRWAARSEDGLGALEDGDWEVL